MIEGGFTLSCNYRVTSTILYPSPSCLVSGIYTSSPDCGDTLLKISTVILFPETMQAINLNLLIPFLGKGPASESIIRSFSMCSRPLFATINMNCRIWSHSHHGITEITSSRLSILLVLRENSGGKTIRPIPPPPI